MRIILEDGYRFPGRESSGMLHSLKRVATRADALQHIMLRLQEKAHFSLNKFKHGDTSRPAVGINAPISSQDDDELALLGGKTRLVAKRGPSSPLSVERSPISQNPVIPFPPFNHEEVDHNVLEYLGSFTRGNQAQMPSSGNTTFSITGQSSSLYEFQNPYDQTPSLNYLSPESQSVQGLLPTHVSSTSDHGHQSMFQPPMAGSHAHVFPPYFPVFDYNNVSRQSSTGFMNGHGARQGTGSPEVTMDATWSAFVDRATEV